MIAMELSFLSIRLATACIVISMESLSRKTFPRIIGRTENAHVLIRLSARVLIFIVHALHA